MINDNVIYNVTGRYMEGQKLIGYHIVGEDGSQARVSKDRAIWLIDKGIIANMRTQLGTDGIIIRGKGVNLNKLPVYDEAKQKFRNNDISQDVANSKVSIQKSSVPDINQMGQYKITKRIMYKNSCLGYEIQACNGLATRKKREDVIELAVQKLISNAIAQKYTKPGDTAPTIILRGVGCDLKQLPILIVTSNGSIIDPSKDKDKVTIRCAYMKSNGVLKDKINKNSTQFKYGDYIICLPNGTIAIKEKIFIDKEYTSVKNTDKATCDDYLSNISNYSIEIFGNKPVQLTDEIVKSWSILKKIDNIK